MPIKINFKKYSWVRPFEFIGAFTCVPRMILFFRRFSKFSLKKTKSLIVIENFIEPNENLGTKHLFLFLCLFLLCIISLPLTFFPPFSLLLLHHMGPDVFYCLHNTAMFVWLLTIAIREPWIMTLYEQTQFFRMLAPFLQRYHSSLVLLLLR